MGGQKSSSILWYYFWGHSNYPMLRIWGNYVRLSAYLWSTDSLVKAIFHDLYKNRSGEIWLFPSTWPTCRKSCPYVCLFGSESGNTHTHSHSRCQNYYTYRSTRGVKTFFFQIKFTPRYLKQPVREKTRDSVRSAASPLTENYDEEKGDMCYAELMR